MIEVYSPPRVNPMLKHMPGLGVVPGLSIDLTTRNERGEFWDLSLPEHQEMELKAVRTMKPVLLIGSPPCGPWSVLQHLHDPHGTPEEIENRMASARVHIQFCIKLYKTQVEAGNWFLHEHPWSAESWQEVEMMELLGMPGVAVVRGDQCQQGMGTWIEGEWRSIRKPTGWMSNCPELLHELGKICGGSGGVCDMTGKFHTPCIRRAAAEAAVYPLRLCRRILSRIRAALRRTRKLEQGIVGLRILEEEHDTEEHDTAEEFHNYDHMNFNTAEEFHNYDHMDCNTAEEFHNYDHMNFNAGGNKVYDALTGYELDTEMVRKARVVELEFVAAKDIWEARPESECWDNAGKGPISVKWVDINKGDNEHPNIRSRLVAREFVARALMPYLRLPRHWRLCEPSCPKQ